MLDAGDLILNFSDGVDDDGNGYVDDIAGWDFFKDDNDPFDDIAAGSGTRLGLAASAETNNQIGGAGVCPLCRVLPLRVADGQVTDANLFAKAVVYSTDNGAKVAIAGLETVNDNAFTSAALDYADQSNLLVVASMGDEGSRQHVVPATTSHVLQVHAVGFDGQGLADSSTFEGFNACSNFGAQSGLTGSASGCSEEATADVGGIAGLVYSAGIQYNVNPPLTSGEVRGLLEGNADDIDISDSQKSGSKYQWSQKGFDQRFGYGRVDASLAVEAVRGGRLPPVVEISSPSWFSVLYKGQGTGKVDVSGKIASTRASSFEYQVQWAPGVQPADADFMTVASDTQLQPGTVVGSSGPLATLDLSTIDPKHVPDTDSPAGENDTAITVRVIAVAHYGGAVGDVTNQTRHVYYVETDDNLVKGFPLFLGDGGDNSPKLADLDGDGTRELIYATGGGLLHAYKIGKNGPVELPGFPFHSNLEDGLISPAPTANTPIYLSAPAYVSGAVDATQGRAPFSSAPAIGDLDGDGETEIVVSSYSGEIYVIGADGQPKPGWPVRLPGVPSCSEDQNQPKMNPCMDSTTRIARGAWAAPVLVDLDQDGNLDVVQAAFDGNVYAFHADGSAVSGWPVAVHYTGSFSEPPTNRILSTPSVGDFNGDGIPDLLVGSNESFAGKYGAMRVLDGRGTNAPSPILAHWPVTIGSESLTPVLADGAPSSGVVSSGFNGKLAAMIQGNGATPMLLPADPTVQTQLGEVPANRLFVPGDGFGAASKATAGPTVSFFSQPSLGDIDQDGVPDLVTVGGSRTLLAALAAHTNVSSTGQHHLAVWSGKDGTMLPGAPMPLEGFSLGSGQAIADLDGDDYPEVITGTGSYFLHAFNGCGVEPKGFPKFTGQSISSTPAVGDLDGDHKLEVVVATRDGWLYAWHTQGKDDGIVEWESFQHDSRNSGNLDVGLGQGTAGKKAATPLTEETCSLSSPTTTSTTSSSMSTSGGGGGGEGGAGNGTDSGGCSCDVPGSDAPNGQLAGLAVAVALWLVRRARPDARAGSGLAAPRESRETSPQ